MKKVQLSIPEPCHENWDAMTPTVQGKFCASCQKAVIDFTEMSDRQLAEFFKKPPSSVCGRFQQDQLNRNIEIPRKRIPWVRYFFQFSLPAFLISMKAGAQIGKPVLKGETVLVPKSDAAKIKPKNFTSRNKTTTSIENPQPICVSSPISMEADKIAELNPQAVNELNISSLLQGRVAGVVIVGGVSSKKSSRPSPKSQSVVKNISDATSKTPDTLYKKISVYPNPLKSNSIIKIDLKKLDAGIYTVSIVGMNGNSIHSKEASVQSKNETISFALKNVSAGTYFIRLFNQKTAASYSQKIIVQ